MIIIDIEKLLSTMSEELSCKSLVSTTDHYWELVTILYEYEVDEKMIVEIIKLVVNKFGYAYHTSIYDLLNTSIDAKESADSGIQLFSSLFLKIYNWRYSINENAK